MTDLGLARAPLAARLRGSTVVIVGGGSGIGRATAEAALGLGAEVVILSRNEAKLAATAQALAKLGRIAWRGLDTPTTLRWWARATTPSRPGPSVLPPPRRAAGGSAPGARAPPSR